MPKRTKDEIALRQSRCPEDWMILADLLEDKGNHTEAAKKRELGAWGRFLFPILGRLGNTYPVRIHTLETLPNKISVQFRRAEKSILMDILEYSKIQYKFIAPYIAKLLDEKGIPRPEEVKSPHWNYLMGKLKAMIFMKEYLSHPRIAEKKIENYQSQNA